jgi:hypothetical protein
MMPAPMMQSERDVSAQVGAAICKIEQARRCRSAGTSRAGAGASPDAPARSGGFSMNQVVTGRFLREHSSAQGAVTPFKTDPIGAAAAAIERCLAQAHEAGNDDAVRLLHAVSAILSASPKA